MLPLAYTYYDAEKREWSGPQKKDAYADTMTLGEVMYDVLSKNCDKVIQICDVTGEQLTCGELLKSAEQLSKHLLLLGLKTGDVIGLYASNTTHVVTVMLTSFLCGTPVNALPPKFDKATVARYPPKIIFCDVENYEIAREVEAELQLKAPIFVMNGVVEGVTNIRDLLSAELSGDNENFRFPCLDLHGDDIANILCTSGTTGPPKAATNSNRALLNRCVFLTIKATSVLFAFSTMNWASGFWTLVASLLNASLRIVTQKPFTPEYFLGLVERHRITHVLTNPSLVAALTLVKDTAKVQQSLASIDSILVGGAPVPLAVQQKMNKILSNNNQRPGLAVIYGLSEIEGLLSDNGSYQCKRLEGSVGKLVANQRVRIVNQKGQLCGPNEHGEICIYSTRWSGYYNNEEATRKTVVDNWFHTADIGYFNDEGYLHFCTRKKDVFMSKNIQIYPQLIEDVVCSLKGVLDACVIGIPDVEATNLIACAVIRTPDEDGLQLSADIVEQHVRHNMAERYHLSGGVYIVQFIPVTNSGKCLRSGTFKIVMKIIEENKLLGGEK